MAKLTNKQKLFIKEYLVDLNATQAAIRSGYSEDSAKAIGYENLTKPHIQEAISNELKKRTSNIDITNERVLNEICKLAFFNIKDLYREDGTLKEINELDENVSAAISAIKINTYKNKDDEDIEEGTKEIKFWDKKSSLELLGRYLKLFTDNQEVKTTISVDDSTKELIDNVLERLK